MAILLVIFLLALIFIALLLAGRMGGKKVPLYVEGNTRDNIMPYSDEGKKICVGNLMRKS